VAAGGSDSDRPKREAIAGSSEAACESEVVGKAAFTFLSDKDRVFCVLKILNSDNYRHKLFIRLKFDSY